MFFQGIFCNLTVTLLIYYGFQFLCFYRIPLCGNGCVFLCLHELLVFFFSDHFFPSWFVCLCFILLWFNSLLFHRCLFVSKKRQKGCTCLWKTEQMDRFSEELGEGKCNQNILYVKNLFSLKENLRNIWHQRAYSLLCCNVTQHKHIKVLIGFQTTGITLNNNM